MEQQNISYTAKFFFTKYIEDFHKYVEGTLDKDEEEKVIARLGVDEFESKDRLVNRDLIGDGLLLLNLRKDSDSRINFKNLAELKKYFEKDDVFVSSNLNQIYILKECCFILVEDIENANFSDIKNIIDEINSGLEKSERFIKYINHDKTLLDFTCQAHYKSQDVNLNNKFVINDGTDHQIAENSLVEFIESYQKEWEHLAEEDELPF